MKSVDLIIIGAGPAGMAAATLAAQHGVSVVLLDEQTQVGGQIYRNVTQIDSQMKALLGVDYAKGAELANKMRAENVVHIASATVWDITNDGQVSYTVNGVAKQLKGRFLLLATGALERPVPVAGWTLPGAMTAGAAQILMKTSGLVAKRAVLAGSGPLLYLVASQMVAAGAPPLALVETQTLGDHFRALRHIGGAIRGWKAIVKGLGLLMKLKLAGVKRYTGIDSFEILGDKKATGIKISKRGHVKTLSCDTVLLHEGVVPNTQFTRALQLGHEWNAQQRCFRPVTDRWGRTKMDSMFVAGDGAGIGGADVAKLAGFISTIEILYSLQKIDKQSRDNMARPLLKAVNKELAVRPFLDTLYAVPDFIARPADDVLICRCEEVSAGDIRRFARLGCMGPNQTKAFGRSGMGPCQGRYCGCTVTEILAEEHNKDPQQIGSYKIRMPIKPVSLGEIATLAESNTKN